MKRKCVGRGSDEEHGKEEYQESEGDKNIEMDIEFEQEDEQPVDLERHFLSHIPFRSWCPHCAARRARDNAHRRRTAPPQYKIPHVVVDYGVLGGYGDSESLVVQVARGVMTGFLFSHVVPRKGLAHVHGAMVLVEDIKRLGHDAATIKADRREEKNKNTLRELSGGTAPNERDSREGSPGSIRADPSNASRTAQPHRHHDPSEAPSDDMPCCSRFRIGVRVPEGGRRPSSACAANPTRGTWRSLARRCSRASRS